MIKVGVKVLTLRYIHTMRSFIMITSQNIINIIKSTWPHSYLRKICGPNSTISILSLILGEIRRVDSVMDVSVPFVPFLVVILFEVVMSGVDGE